MTRPHAQLSLALAAFLALGVSPHPGAASVGLANPAAAFCIETGGLYGTRETDAGRQGICRLPGGDVIDAWAHFREAVEKEPQMDKSHRPNPAASYCTAVGGTYDLAGATCVLADGARVDAWALLRQSHAGSPSLANPAASFCIASGGAYEIRAGEDGQTGICRLPDGTEQDAWALFRERN